jgi:F0F1-type ATP synthase membrane subunit b/b'
MTEDNSGSAVSFVLLIGIALTFAGCSILKRADTADALLRDKEAQISQLQQSLAQCQYEYQGYKDGRR